MSNTNDTLTASRSITITEDELHEMIALSNQGLQTTTDLAIALLTLEYVAEEGDTERLVHLATSFRDYLSEDALKVLSDPDVLQGFEEVTDGLFEEDEDEDDFTEEFLAVLEGIAEMTGVDAEELKAQVEDFLS